MIEGRQKAACVGGDFLEDDGHIPRGLEAGSGRFRGLRLGVCRGGKEQDSQPHCFNLSRGTNQRPIKRGRWGFACCGVRNYSPPGGGGGGGGAGGAPVGAPVPVPVPVVVPVVLPLSPCTPPLDATGPLPPTLPGLPDR